MIFTSSWWTYFNGPLGQVPEMNPRFPDVESQFDLCLTSRCRSEFSSLFAGLVETELVVVRIVISSLVGIEGVRVRTEGLGRRALC